MHPKMMKEKMHDTVKHTNAKFGWGTKTGKELSELNPKLELIKESSFWDEMIRWGLEHGKYAYEAEDAFGYAQKMNKFQMMDIADKVTQDILIVGANKDHFIPYSMVGEEINALKNVRSLTFRLFTDKEDACNHCNLRKCEADL